jgi:hypothetical protein
MIFETSDIPLNIIKGEDRIYDLTFLRIVDELVNPMTTTPVDLTGATIYFTIKDWLWDADSEAILQLDSTGSKVVITDATNGKFTVKVEKEDLINLPTDKYRYDIQVKLGQDAGGLSAGDIITPYIGEYTILDTANDKLEFIREDTNFFNLQVQIYTDAESTPKVYKNINITSATYQFLAKELVDDADSDNLIGAPTVTIVSALEGKLKLTFDPADTAAIEYLGTKKRELYFWLKMTLGTSTGNSPYVTGDTIIPISGKLTVYFDRTLT